MGHSEISRSLDSAVSDATAEEVAATRKIVAAFAKAGGWEQDELLVLEQLGIAQ